MNWAVSSTGLYCSGSSILTAADRSSIFHKQSKRDFTIWSGGVIKDACGLCRLFQNRFLALKSNFSQSIEEPWGQCKKRRAANVLAYYGLRRPPYKLDALEPYMSKKTLELHWGEHYREYVDALNKQLGKNDKLYGFTLQELIRFTYNNGNPMPEFNNAAELWNHDFFWESMQPGGGQMPILGLFQQIEKDFGSFSNFQENFIETAISLFGSGWVWLVMKREEQRLAIVKTSNAVNPIVWNDIPIINLDMWEHAYYLDYKNDRAKYVNMFMNHLVSWNAATVRMARAQAFVNLGEPKIPIA